MLFEIRVPSVLTSLGAVLGFRLTLGIVLVRKKKKHYNEPKVAGEIVSREEARNFFFRNTAPPCVVNKIFWAIMYSRSLQKACKVQLLHPMKAVTINMMQVENLNQLIFIPFSFHVAGSQTPDECDGGGFVNI